MGVFVFLVDFEVCKLKLDTSGEEDGQKSMAKNGYYVTIRGRIGRCSIRLDEIIFS